MTLLPFLFLFIIIGIFTFAIVLSNKRTAQVWTAAAQDLGLQYGNASKRITGLYENLKVFVEPCNNSRHSSESTTRYRVRFSYPLNLRLNLFRQTFLKRLSRFFGTQDILVDDEAFDREVVIQGSDRKAICNFLTCERKALVLSLMERFPIVLIDDHEILIETKGNESTRHDIVKTVKALAEAAHAMAPERKHLNQEPKVMPRPEEKKKKKGLKPQQAAQADKNPAATPPPVPAPEPVPEVPAEAAEVEAADALLSELESTVEELTSKAPAPEAEEAIPEEVPAEVKDTKSENSQEDRGVAGFCESLFGDKQSSAEVAKAIGELKGADLACPAKLISCQHFTYDRHFNNSSGFKAVFEIHQMQRSYGSKALVKAVIQLPEEVGAVLKRHRKGDRFTICGEFLTADSLLHELYLADGTIVDGLVMENAA